MENEEPPALEERIARLKHPRLRLLVESYYDVQKLRIATANRLKAYSRLGAFSPLQAAKLQEIVSDLLAEERKLLRQIEEELEAVPVWRWLRTIKGIGPAMAGGLVAWIDDISRSPHVSSLWRYAGLHVEDGKAPRRRRGEKAPWNQKLRTHLWKCVKQILQAGDPFYRRWYDEYKRREMEKCRQRGIRVVPAAQLPTRDGKKYEPEGVMSLQHLDNRARRKVIKLLAAHIWQVWREMEGLPVNPPYASKLGHEVIPPPNWPLPAGEGK